MRGSREGWGVRTPSEICKNKKILYIISRVRFLNKWREPPHLHSGFFFLDPCLSLIDFRKSQKSKWHGPKRPEVEITHHQLCLDIMFVCIYMYIYIYLYIRRYVQDPNRIWDVYLDQHLIQLMFCILYFHFLVFYKKRDNSCQESFVFITGCV